MKLLLSIFLLLVAALAGAQTTTIPGSAVSAGFKLTTVNASRGLILGDSTIAAYLGQDGIDAHLLTSSDVQAGTIISNQAVPANTILQQQSIWTADTNKHSYDWIVVEIGLNDTLFSESAATAMGRYQTLIDTINAGKKPSAVVVVSTMTPCRQRLIDLYGATDGETAYQKWLAMNVSIMGGGATPVTGVRFRASDHTSALNDGLGNMAAPYNVDPSDGVHENNSARRIIASSWRRILNRVGYLENETAADFDFNLTRFGTNTTTISAGNFGVGTTNPVNKLDVEGGVGIGVAVSSISIAPTNGLLVQGRVGLGLTGVLYNVHIRDADAATAPSLGTASGALSIDGGNNSPEAAMGINMISPFGFWIQAKDTAASGQGSGASYPISFNPLGGGVGIGTMAPSSSLDVIGQVRAASAIITNMAGSGDFVAVNASGLFLRTNAPGSGISGIIAGNSNQIPYLDHTGTNYVYGAGLWTAPGFGFSPSGPHGLAYGGLMVWGDEPMGLLTIGHPNPASDFSEPATALVVSNRYNGAADFQNDMIKIDAVMVGGGLSSTSTMTRWRVWQSTTSSNDVAKIDVSGLFTTTGFKMTNGAERNKQLRSVDSGGVGVWGNPQAGGNGNSGGGGAEPPIGGIQFGETNVAGLHMMLDSTNTFLYRRARNELVVTNTGGTSNTVIGAGYIKTQLLEVNSLNVATLTVTNGIPAFGANGNVQYASDGLLDSEAALNYDNAANTLTVQGGIIVTNTGNGLKLGPGNTTLTNMLVGAASLDFPSTVAGTSSDLPITVTGCTSNNCHVSICVPWQAASGGGIFTHFESNDVVYIRFSNNQLTLAIDPTPATFSALVFKVQ